MRDPDTASLQEPTAPAALPAGDGGRKSALLIVFLVVFIDLLGFGIVLPLLPLYADEILEPLFPAQERVQGMFLGLLMASFSAMQFFFAPLWGRISDRLGRRPILLLGLAGSVIFYTLFGVASELALGPPKLYAVGLVLLFASRLGAGIAGATISTAQAVIADITPPEKRARGMALIGAAFGIGFTFGPLLGFGSLFVGLAGAPGYMAAGLSLVAFLLGLSILPETLRPGSSALLRRRLVDWGGLARVLRTPSVGILVVTFFLATVAFGGLESTLSLGNKLLLTGEDVTRLTLTREAARTTEQSNFLVFAYVGLVLMLTQGLFYRRLVQRVGEVRFLRAGILLMGIGLTGAVAVLLARDHVQSRAPLLVVALVIMSVAVVGFALLTPSVQSLISRRSDPARQGEVLGVNQSASAMARILGPLFALPLYKLTPSHVWPYALGAVLLASTFVLSLRIRRE
jgi:DHA1 family tetracycline resistance protein-like MFS transporter